MRKKTGGTTPTRRPDIGTVPRPTLASGPLTVEAQGAILKDDDRLIVAVRVRDAAGEPVTGLKKQHFKLWQLGHFFSSLDGFFVVELEGIAGLEGLYHLVRTPWSLVGNGTIPFYVRVAKGALRTGGALTCIVKVREGLDT
jgi:hypothetical protein